MNERGLCLSFFVPQIFYLYLNFFQNIRKSSKICTRKTHLSKSFPILKQWQKQQNSLKRNHLVWLQLLETLVVGFMEVSCPVLHSSKLLKQPKQKKKTCKPKNVENRAMFLSLRLFPYSFPFAHTRASWNTIFDEMTEENSTESVNNFPFEY